MTTQSSRPQRPTPNQGSGEIIDVTPVEAPTEAEASVGASTDAKAVPPPSRQRNKPHEEPPVEKSHEDPEDMVAQHAQPATTVVETAIPTVQKELSPEAKNAAMRLMEYIGDDECSEVLLNGPNECSRKVRGTRYHAPDVSFGDAETYHQVLNEYLLPNCETPDRVDGSKVIVEGQLELLGRSGQSPMYARVHIVAPPGVKYAKVTIAKKPRVEIGLDDMVSSGTLSPDAGEFLKSVARGHKTIVVSGPTGAGKSTLLQALTHYFDVNDRVVVVEETPELRLPLGDVVYLKSSLELPGQDASEIYSLGFWVKQANRMRMDRVIVGETRGAELSEWLIAANSGAEGSVTTVHAHSPRRTLDKMLALASKDVLSTSEDQLRREIAATVDLIIQLGLVDGKHVVTAIEEISNTVTGSTGQIQSTTIFSFDRSRNAHMAVGRPSDDFVQGLGQEGIALNPDWFKRSA